MDASFECLCGAEMAVTGSFTGKRQGDLRAECPRCDRGYVDTISRYEEPSL